MVKGLIAVGLTAAVVMVAVFAVGARAQEPARPIPDVVLSAGADSSMGIAVRDLTREEADAAKLSQVGGALVTRVVAAGPAARAGLRNGDVVTEFDGERVRSARHLSRLVQETPPGRPIGTALVRDGARQTVEVTLESRRAYSDFRGAGRELGRQMEDLGRYFTFELDSWPPFRRGLLGLTLSPLGDQLAAYFGARRGVLVAAVDPDSAGARAGVKAGDVITAVNGRPVEVVGDVARHVRGGQPGSAIDITLMRDKKEMTLQAVVPERSRPRSDERRPSRSRDL